MVLISHCQSDSSCLKLDDVIFIYHWQYFFYFFIKNLTKAIELQLDDDFAVSFIKKARENSSLCRRVSTNLAPLPGVQTASIAKYTRVSASRNRRRKYNWSVVGACVTNSAPAAAKRVTWVARWTSTSSSGERLLLLALTGPSTRAAPNKWERGSNPTSSPLMSARASSCSCRLALFSSLTHSCRRHLIIQAMCAYKWNSAAHSSFCHPVWGKTQSLGNFILLQKMRCAAARWIKPPGGAQPRDSRLYIPACTAVFLIMVYSIYSKQNCSGGDYALCTLGLAPLQRFSLRLGASA